MTDNGETSGSAGLLIAFCMLVAGIVAIVTRNKSKGGPITAGGIYALGGIIGIATNSTLYGDLKVWAVLSLIFAAVFILGGIKQKDDSTTE
jgi:Ca2+/Na+ antiporter